MVAADNGCCCERYLTLQELVALCQHPVHVSQGGSGQVLQSGSTICGAYDYAAFPWQYEQHPAVAGLRYEQTKVGRADVIGENSVHL